MKKLFIIIASLAVSGVSAQEKVLLGRYTPKQTLSLFKETEGLELDVSSKDKKATISIQKEFSSDSVFKAQIIGKFDGDDTSYADEEGLVNDVALKISHTNIYYDTSKMISIDTGIVEQRSIKMSKLKTKYLACANVVNQVQDGETYLTYLDRIKKEKMDTEINLSVCRNESLAIDSLEKDTDAYQFYRSYWYNTNSFQYSPGEHKYYDLASNLNKSNDTESVKFSTELGFFEVAGTDSEQWWDYRKFGLGVEYSKGDAAQESDKSNICKPLDNATTYSTCFDTYLQPAYESESLAFYAKYAFRRDGNSIIKGADIIVKYSNLDKNYIDDEKDVDTNRWSVSLPLTLFVTKEYDFKAGVSVLWRQHLDSDRADFDVLTVGLFVSSGFDLSAL
jgi:hypothetical protein